MYNLLVDFYQDCSYDAPGVKLGPAPGVTSLKPPAEWGDRNSSAVALQQGYDPPTVPARLPWAATRVA